jgi:hypothetical protein
MYPSTYVAVDTIVRVRDVRQTASGSRSTRTSRLRILDTPSNPTHVEDPLVAEPALAARIEEVESMLAAGNLDDLPPLDGLIDSITPLLEAPPPLTNHDETPSLFNRL